MYGPLKVAWRQVCHEFLTENPGTAINKHNFSSLLSKAWLQSMLPKNAIAGFRTTGVYPPSRHAIKIPGEMKDVPSLSGKHGMAYIPLYTPMKRRVSQSAPYSLSVSSEDLMYNHHDPESLKYDLIMSESSESSQPQLESFGTAVYQSGISKFLDIPTPPKPRKLPEHTVASRVLTSVENLQRMEERVAQEKARLKEVRVRKRKEKRKNRKRETSKPSNLTNAKGASSYRARKGSSPELSDNLLFMFDNMSERDSNWPTKKGKRNQKKGASGLTRLTRGVKDNIKASKRMDQAFAIATGSSDSSSTWSDCDSEISGSRK